MTVVAVVAIAIGRLYRGAGTTVPPPSTAARAPKTDNFRFGSTIWLVAFALSLLIAIVVWPGFATTPKPPQTDGGVLLMHDYVQPTEGNYLDLRASIEAKQWETGQTGMSILQLRITFDAPVLGHHWYVVASGDYAVDPAAPVEFYCIGAEERGGGIECPVREFGDGMRYEFDQQLSPYGGTSEIVASLVDLNGYSSSDVTVVTGLIPEPDEFTGEAQVTVALPISSPQVAKVTGNEFVRYGRIGFSDWEWGSGPPLDQGCTLRAPARGVTFVLVSSCSPLEPISVTSTMFDSGFEIDERTIEYSSPDVESDDRLTWAVDGPFPGGQALINDPFEEGQETRRAFGAGLFLSLAASFLTLFIQGWRRQDQDS